MISRALALSFLAMAPAIAGPDIGPKVERFDFTGYGWLETGGLFCLDEAGCTHDGPAEWLYLRADPVSSELRVYLVGETVPDGAYGPGATCTVALNVLTGQVYGPADGLVYVAQPALMPDDGRFRFDLLAIDLTPLDGPVPGIRFDAVPIDVAFGGDYTDRQSQLIHRLWSDGGLAALRDPDWPEAWAAIRANALRVLSETWPDDTLVRITFYRRASTAERDMIVGAARSGGLLIGPDPPFTVKDCLPAGFLSDPPE